MGKHGTGGETHPALEHALEAVHSQSSDMVVQSLLPAICVAWADGGIDPKEREEILLFADELGIATIPGGMEQLEKWLQKPPAPEQVEVVLSRLRVGEGAPPDRAAAVEQALFWARTVATVDGGFLGVGTVSGAEWATLRQLKGALNGALAGPVNNGLRLARVAGAFLRSRDVEETAYVDHLPPPPRPSAPVSSPMNAARLPPAVLHVPDSDYVDYKDLVVNRYLRTVREDWWETAHFASRSRGVAPMTDAELHRLLYHTPFSRFIVSLDPVDEARFAGVMQAEPRTRWAKVDFSHLGSWKPLEGLQVAPTVALLDLDATERGVRAIAVRERVFVAPPRHGEPSESWKRARYFLLQGASNALVVGIHPHLHFPLNSVIALTRSLLPKTHRVARLIEAHAYLHLPIDFGVLWNQRSAARNHQAEVYTAFPADWTHVFRSIGDYYSGLEGNSGYPGYRYPLGPPAVIGPYGDFLRDYYEVVLAHCRRVASAGSVDAALLAWARALSELLPGFPDADALQEDDVLARVLAGFVHSASVWHSAEHHAYGKEPVSRVPLRLRVAEPVGKDGPSDPTTWLAEVDVLRQELSRQMFYQDHPVRTLLEVEYGFAEPALQGAEARFFDELRACAAKQAAPFIPLEQMACSIQY